jgi:hypothetical protein
VQDDIKPSTHWLLVCTQREEARGSISEAAMFLSRSSSSSSRLALLPYTLETEIYRYDLLTKVLVAAVGLKSQTDKIPDFLQSLTKDALLWEGLRSTPWEATVMQSDFESVKHFEKVLRLADVSGLNVDHLTGYMVSGLSNRILAVR